MRGGNGGLIRIFREGGAEGGGLVQGLWIQAGIRDPRTGSGHLRRRLVGRSGRDVLKYCPPPGPVHGEVVVGIRPENPV